MYAIQAWTIVITVGFIAGVVLIGCLCSIGKERRNPEESK